MKFVGHEEMIITPEILSQMDDDTFFDIMPSFPKCIKCKHCGNQSCKRFGDSSGDINITPYRPFFSCETTGLQSCPVCGDVAYKPLSPAISQAEFMMILDEYMNRECPKDMSVFVNRDTNLAYTIPFMLYFNGDWIDESGTLKYTEKMYYKIDRKSPTGYRLVHEKGNMP